MALQRENLKAAVSLKKLKKTPLKFHRTSLPKEERRLRSLGGCSDKLWKLPLFKETSAKVELFEKNRTTTVGMKKTLIYKSRTH